MIIVSGLNQPHLRAMIEKAAGSSRLVFAENDEHLLALAPDAEIVAGPLPEDALAAAQRLVWVHSWSAGPDTQLYPAMVESSVLLTCSKGNGAIPLAEHALMLMLMLNRDALRWVSAQRDRRWDRFVHGELNGLTCGIIGTGHSGQDLALKTKAFHMRTLGLRRVPQPTPHFDRIYPREQIHEFLAESDFVVVTAPLTNETRGMLGAEEFHAMKPTAHYICISRGGIADDHALLHVLKAGRIAGAGLDAQAEEPLPEDSPFWTLSNVIITPHNGATSHRTPERGVEIFIENLRRYRAAEPLVNLVDKEAGY